MDITKDCRKPDPEEKKQIRLKKNVFFNEFGAGEDISSVNGERGDVQCFDDVPRDLDEYIKY